MSALASAIESNGSVARTRALAHVPRSKSAILDLLLVLHAPMAHKPQPWGSGPWGGLCPVSRLTK